MVSTCNQQTRGPINHIKRPRQVQDKILLTCQRNNGSPWHYYSRNTSHVGTWSRLPPFCDYLTLTMRMASTMSITNLHDMGQGMGATSCRRARQHGRQGINLIYCEYKSPSTRLGRVNGIYHNRFWRKPNKLSPSEKNGATFIGHGNGSGGRYHDGICKAPNI